MRVGLVCPYPWDVPGGVQAHVRGLAEALLDLGHEVSVLTPVDDDAALPAYAVGAGRALPVPYNGSVARLLLGPVSAARVRRWLRDGHFDVLHAHEPTAPSISLLACMQASGPLVATFHTANPRSKILTAAQPALTPAFEKIRARIAVSEAARRTIVEHLGVDATVIPNGVALRPFAGSETLPGRAPDGATVAFLGRIDEPRKGLQVLLEALPRLLARVPGARLLVAGPGDVEQVRQELDPALAGHVELLGLVSEADKARLLHSADVYCAPNTGQESFGIVLLEAMAAGVPVLASDLDAFRRVLDDGRAGRLFPVGSSDALAAALADLLADPAERAKQAAAGRLVAQRYDWHTVAGEVLRVYETVTEGVGAVSLDPAPTATQDFPVLAAADDGSVLSLVEPDPRDGGHPADGADGGARADGGDRADGADGDDGGDGGDGADGADAARLPWPRRPRPLGLSPAGRRTRRGSPRDPGRGRSR